MAETDIDVLGIGNAIVDVLTDADDGFLEDAGLAKGSMTLIDGAKAAELYAQIEGAVECSGGSAANTMVGLASLGSRSAYLGKVAADPLGRVFGEGLDAAGVRFRTPPLVEGPGTGRCLVLVTPDAQRTMQTYLGASAFLGPEDVDPNLVRSSSVTYLEGYQWDSPSAKQAFLVAAEMAHDAGRRIAMTLSDAFCVDRHREEFLRFIQGHVDVLFANEAEIVSLFEVDAFDAAVERLAGCCEIAALTRGELGSVVVHGGASTTVEAEPVERVVDTTGAGDLYASGFLHGLTLGADMEICARIGGIAAAEVISHFGARPAVELAGRVRHLLEASPERRS